MLNAAVIANAELDPTGTFAATLTLKDGANAIGLTLLSGKDVIARSAYTVILDKQPPTLDVIGPANGALIEGPNVVVQGKAEVGAGAKADDWRVARTVFVADDDKVAERYGKSDAASPYRFYYSQMHSKLIRSKRLFVFKSHREQPDDEITQDFVLDNLVIHGTVNSVVDQILALRDEVGDFGELVYGGMDWVDPALAKRSMQLVAEQVMPRVNAAIGKKSAAA